MHQAQETFSTSIDPESPESFIKTAGTLGLAAIPLPCLPEMTTDMISPAMSAAEHDVDIGAPMDPRRSTRAAGTNMTGPSLRQSTPTSFASPGATAAVPASAVATTTTSSSSVVATHSVDATPSVDATKHLVVSRDSKDGPVKSEMTDCFQSSEDEWLEFNRKARAWFGLKISLPRDESDILPSQKPQVVNAVEAFFVGIEASGSLETRRAKCNEVLQSVGSLRGTLHDVKKKVKNPGELWLTKGWRTDRRDETIFVLSKGELLDERMLTAEIKWTKSTSACDNLKRGLTDAMECFFGTSGGRIPTQAVAVKLYHRNDTYIDVNFYFNVGPGEPLYKWKFSCVPGCFDALALRHQGLYETPRPGGGAAATSASESQIGGATNIVRGSPASQTTALSYKRGAVNATRTADHETPPLANTAVAVRESPEDLVVLIHPSSAGDPMNCEVLKPSVCDEDLEAKHVSKTPSNLWKDVTSACQAIGCEVATKEECATEFMKEFKLNSRYDLDEGNLPATTCPVDRLKEFWPKLNLDMGADYGMMNQSRYGETREGFKRKFGTYPNKVENTFLAHAIYGKSKELSKVLGITMVDKLERMFSTFRHWKDWAHMKVERASVICQKKMKCIDAFGESDNWEIKNQLEGEEDRLAAIQDAIHCLLCDPYKHNAVISLV